MQQPTGFDQTVHAARDRVAKRHPRQGAHNEECTHRMRRSALPKTHGKHHIKHEVISRHREQRLQVGPQHTRCGAGVAGCELAPGKHPHQRTGAPQRLDFSQQHGHQHAKANSLKTETRPGRGGLQGSRTSAATEPTGGFLHGLCDVADRRPSQCTPACGKHYFAVL